jgi:hypothetical protein
VSEIFNCIDGAMRMMDHAEQPPKNWRPKPMAVAFATVTAAIAAQTLVLDDGTAIYVETEKPPIVWALMAREGDTVTVKSMHHTREEAEAAQARAERAAMPEGAIQ